jgi:uncharacterized protein YcbK (DUF882 family)
MGDPVDRRQAIKWILSGLALPMFPGAVTSAFAAVSSKNRSGMLSFYNVHTDETIKVRYLNNRGQFDSVALKELNHFFRCRYTNKIHKIDPGLFYWMDIVKTQLGVPSSRYQLFSGYRSPEYNRYLRRKNLGVARRSFHVKGMAADVFLEKVSLSTLKKKATRLAFGGVARYGNFVHMDVGPLRTW